MPLPVLYSLLLALGLFSFLRHLVVGKAPLINVNSDCTDEFLAFNEDLKVTKSKLKKLRRARRAIQDKLRIYFRELNGYTTPKFYIQGSSQVGTLIRNKKDFCDFDIGLYFFTEPPHKFETVQRHVKKALTGHTNGRIRLLEKCVRIKYSGDFHIDIPIYFTSDKQNYYLGSKSNGWNLCDSKVFKDWVVKHTDSNGQLIRLIRYFKAWADNNSRKLPNGLAFTIWVINNYEPDNRDDVAIVQTAASILKNLKSEYWRAADWECIMPVEPHDNVLDNLDSDQKSSFNEALRQLIKDGTIALSSERKESALYVWKKLFGKRFHA